MRVAPRPKNGPVPFSAALCAIMVWASAATLDAAEKALPAPEPTWSFPAGGPLRALVVRGLWQEQYRLDEALTRAGAGLLDDCWVWDGAAWGWLRPGDQGGGGIMDFPDDAGLSDHDVVIVAHANAKSFGSHAKPLADYVHNGGSVLFLGGRFAFGKQYRDSAFAEMAPGEFPGLKRWGSDLECVPAGIEIKPGKDVLGSGFASLPGARKPLRFWYHEVTPKSGAKVLLTASEKPMLVAGEYGKGRVAVFAGTVMGEPSAEQTAFWDWEGWPTLVSMTVQWLAETPRKAGPATVSGSMRKAIGAAMAKKKPAGSTARAKAGPDLDALLLAEARHCQDQAAAEFLLNTAAGTAADLSPPLAEALQAAAWPVVGSGAEKAARELIRSGQLGKTSLGVALLGASHARDAATVLGRFYETGKPQAASKSEEGVIADLLEGTRPARVEPVLDLEGGAHATAIRLAALAGLGHLGTAEALPTLRKAVNALCGAGAPRPKDYAEALTDENRLYQQAAVSALRCGDEASAAPVVDAVLENIYVLARARGEEHKAKDRPLKSQSLIGEEVAWQRELYRQLATVPDSVRPALARRIAAEQDRRVTALALAVFGGRPLSADLASILKTSPVPAVATLGGRK